MGQIRRPIVLVVVLVLAVLAGLGAFVADQREIAMVAVTGVVMIARELLTEAPPPAVPETALERFLEALEVLTERSGRGGAA